MKACCDLHIHTALSPCGDMDMTPNNIVNMSVLNGLDMIAITDHNTIGNAAAVMECAKGKPLIVVPGMELETAEEAHFVCLFPSLEQAQQFAQWLAPFHAPIQNRPDIFGEQALMDHTDTITGYESRMLVTASTCSVWDAAPAVREIGGIIYPAHVDRDSYSIITNLGTVPSDLAFTAVEFSRHATREGLLSQCPYLTDYRLITGSDAHYLGDIYENENVLELDELSVNALFCYLTGK